MLPLPRLPSPPNAPLLPRGIPPLPLLLAACSPPGEPADEPPEVATTMVAVELTKAEVMVTA